MCALNQSEGNRNNPYTFNDFLFVRNNFDYYEDDEFFQALVKYHTGNEFEKIDQELRKLSKKVSFYYRDLADKAGTLENRIKNTIIQHFDAHNHRIDRLNRCSETEILERDIFGLGLWDPERNSAWSRFCKMFLLYQNGEFGVMCPVSCTHGMIELLQKFEKDLSSESLEILRFTRNGFLKNNLKEYAIGAQFITEIQGGSDVPSNLVEAVFEENEGLDGISNCWRLYGQKFFCSAMQCDYSIVTAKPKGTKYSNRVAVFVVPSWLPGNKEKEIRNSYTIDRLKYKLGTAELPTAEITYNGAVAYPIGPLEEGLANIVGIVLTLSRLHVAFGTAAGGLRISREAILYAQFRTAFGINVSLFPMLMNQINELKQQTRRTAAAAFKIYAEFIALGEDLTAGLKILEAISDIKERKRRFRLRELIMLQKIVVAYEAPRLIRLAISFYGGHGIMEDFLCFSRLLRDSFIQELWEGPRNVLLTQIHRDFSRVKKWYSPDEFVRDILEGLDPDTTEPLAAEFLRLMSHESLLKNDEETLNVCQDWEDFSTILFSAYQELAYLELNYQEKPLKFSNLLRKFKKRTSLK
ncbi:MAG: acyl-CoA dehydrogenase [Candidatus Lokiarchaeota archaeon]|nr:acyl-CoA dehydrogenase [Candidatus Lokiarchaeota archaeon]